MKTISVRYLVIDCLALYLKGTEIFLKFAGHWLLCFFLLKTISVRSLVIDCLALYLKGTEMFLFVEDDFFFSSIHCYRLLGLIFERY